MAVYERSYKGYGGTTTAEWSRFLILPRYAYQEVFKSKGFIVFCVACFLQPLTCAVFIYLPHNLKILEAFPAAKAFAEGARDWMFPIRFMYAQGFLSFLMVLHVGPALVSSDLRNNGLPLYLARPFSRSEYVLGKLSVLVILISAITWVPGLLLFCFQSYMMGWSWFTQNLRMPFAILLGSAIWILVVSLLALAVSAYVKWKPVARLALLGFWLLSASFAGMVGVFFSTDLARVFNFSDMMHVVWGQLFGQELIFDFPAPLAWGSLLLLCLACLALLARKVKAYEVVRS